MDAIDSLKTGADRELAESRDLLWKKIEADMRRARVPVCPECCAKMLPLHQKDFEDHIPERAWYCPNQGEAAHEAAVTKMERDHAAARDQEEASA